MLHLHFTDELGGPAPGGRWLANVRPENGPSRFLALGPEPGPGSIRYTAIPAIEHPPLDPEPVYPEIAHDGKYRPTDADEAPAAPTVDRGVYLVFSNCTDPAREEEFNRWYTHIHVPDLAAARGVVGASRWRTDDPAAPGRYLAIYEFDDPDLRAAMADFQRLGTATMAGRIIDVMESTARSWWWEVAPSALG